MPPELESSSERVAREALESVLGRQLTRFRTQSGRPTPDYADELHEAFEMKELTSEEFRRLRAQTQEEGWFTSQKLAKRWSVLIEAPTLADKFRPVPNFPADDPQQIADLEAQGFTVMRKAEGEVQWAARFAGQLLRTPRIRGLARALEEHLNLLEQAGITDTRTARSTTNDLRHALTEISQLTHGAICMATEPFGGQAGIQLSLGFGYMRTGRADVIAFRVQGWLDSELSFNLRRSLGPEFSSRHGVLIFDPSEPEYWSAQEIDGDFLPATHLNLPSEIDVLWCIVGQRVLRFEPALGWQSFEVN